MIFNSVTFIVFLLVVVTSYWLLPTRQRMWMLLVASCVFYGFWRWEFLSVMFISALTDYFTARAIFTTPIENRRRRRVLLAITLVVNLGLLAYFKYLFFFAANANSLLNLFGTAYSFPLIQVILPLGISFYTFETISYTVDVYRGIIPVEKSFLNYGLFVTFFPKLVAGPIQRAGELLDQLKNRPRFRLEYINDGVRRILYGLFLKVVLADTIGPLVDEGFEVPWQKLSALDVWTLAFLFGLQIYFDFSAYSHIALGSAKLMGITVPENFNFPYIATSFKDFWKRWHISLSSWIRDYLYLPMSGVQVSKSTGAGGIGSNLSQQKATGHGAISLFATWAIMGLWHGANWTYVAWGIYHACLIYIERLITPFRSRINLLNHGLIGWALTVPFAMLGWILFRATSLHQGLGMLRKVFVPTEYRHLNFRENTYLVTAVLFLLVFLTYFIQKHERRLLATVLFVRLPINVARYAFLAAATFVFLRPIRQYIYFQF